MYNNIERVLEDGSYVMGNTVNPLSVLQVIANAARLGPRMSVDIGLSYSKKQLTWKQGQDIWLQERGSVGSMIHRLTAGWLAQTGLRFVLPKNTTSTLKGFESRLIDFLVVSVEALPVSETLRQ